MSKEKAIKYITKAEEQLSDDLLSVRFCQMALNNLYKALKELEDLMIIALLITNIVLTLYSLYNIAAVQHLLKGLIEALSGD